MDLALRGAVAPEIAAVDSNALRWAFNKGNGMKYNVGAWSEGNSLVLEQLKVEHKSNEITTVP